MVISDTIAGRIDETYSYQYDVGADVLYIRKISSQGQTAYGEETDEGFVLFRDEADNFMGITFVNWWKRYGNGSVAVSTLSSITERIEQQVVPLLAA